MLFQIGYAKPGVAIETLGNGSVWANRGLIAGFGGRMEVESTATVTARGAPASFAMQIRVEGPPSRAFIIVERIDVAGRLYDDLAALALALGGDVGWLGHLVAAVHREIDVAIEFRRLPSETREVAPLSVDTSADETRRLRRMV